MNEFERYLETNPTANRDYERYASDPLTQARLKYFWLCGKTVGAREITAIVAPLSEREAKEVPVDNS
jgi:hypothetical protein